MRRLACALVAVAAAAVPAAVARGAGDATAVISPVGMYVAHDPIPVLGGDGRMHLAYEIKVANQTDLEVTLESLQATANGKPIGRLYDPTVLATVMRIDGDGTGTTVGPGQGATVFMDVAYPVKRKTPPKLRHVVNLSFRPEGSTDPPTTQAYTGVKVAVNDSEPLNVEPPLRGERWLIGNGCCDKITAHRGATLAINGTIDAPERFAIDFVQLTAADALVDGPYGNLASWPFFGDKIHAATDGKVVKIQDGLPEQTPGVFPPTRPCRRRAATSWWSASTPVTTPSTPTCSPAACASRSATACAPARCSACSATPATRTGRTCTSTSWTAPRRCSRTGCRSRSPGGVARAWSPTRRRCSRASRPRWTPASSPASAARRCRSTISWSSSAEPDIFGRTPRHGGAKAWGLVNGAP